MNLQLYTLLNLKESKIKIDIKLFFASIFISMLFQLKVCAQIDSVHSYLSSAKQAYSLGDYANSAIDFKKAFNHTSLLRESFKEKKLLQLESLKGLITVSGMGTAMGIAVEAYRKNESLIFENLCTSEHKSVQIGLINNFIAVAYYNNYFEEAIETYQKYITLASQCENFRDIDLVQSTANVVLAYSKQKETDKVVKLLPLLSYYKDSIPNWTAADYEKVLGYVKSNTNSSKFEIINHYKNAAYEYELVNNYRYALDVYNTLLSDYTSYLTNEDLIKIIEKSKIAKDKSPYYHTDLYNKMMKQFGVAILERATVEEENRKLKNFIFSSITIALISIIILLLFVNKRNKEKKNIYKKLYHTEKQLKIQQEKLADLKNNFIKQNYTVSPIDNKNKRFDDLYNTLIKDFPQLNYNIHNNYPNLTKKEIQIIYLSLLGISNKESASLLSLTYGSYRVAKNRLLKKMNCKDKLHFEHLIKELLT